MIWEKSIDKPLTELPREFISHWKYCVKNIISKGNEEEGKDDYKLT